MAAAVVYDGAGSGGTLFLGKKFWVAQRVPSRSRWLALLEANGGHVVQLEKLADILIADHLRKEAPPGSYSWRWIEESVKKGALEDLEAYRAGPPIGVSRTVGSTHPPKATRTPFTPADDRALALWVTNAERQGLSTKGNDIYQQLERINPRHPYQSWRDRWVKYGQFQPRPDITSSPTAQGPVLKLPSATRTKAFSNGSTPGPVISTTKTHTPKSKILSKPATLVTEPAQGSPFTEADGKRLLDIYDDILNIDETKLFEAWERFAEEFPQHTAKEWYKFWMVHIKPLRSSAHRSSVKRKFQSQSTGTEASENSQEVDASTKVSDVSIRTRGDLQREQETLREPPTAKERFERLIMEYADAQNMELDLQPTISGRKVQLFDLWTITMKPSFNGSDEEATNKWDQIAEELGFENSINHDASEELKDMYDWILANFARVRSATRSYLINLLNSGETLSEEQAFDLECLTPIGYEEEDRRIMRQVQEENVAEREVPEIPSSPPQRILPSTKRDHPGTFDIPTERNSSRLHEPTPRKRQRVDKEKEKVLEIPSTPEDLLITTGEVHQSSPIRGQDLGLEQSDDDGISEEEDDQNMFVRSVQRKIFSSSRTSLKANKTVQFEPETQDFHFSKAVDEESGRIPSQMVQEDPLAAGESLAAVAGSQREESSTQSQTDSQREAKEVQELVDHYISLGYPGEVVQEAMLATTLETGDVATVMEAIMQGRGIPDNIEGVWTTEDDRAVRLDDNDEEYARAVLKHTEARCVKRRQLLSQKEVLK